MRRFDIGWKVIYHDKSQIFIVQKNLLYCIVLFRINIQRYQKKTSKFHCSIMIWDCISGKELRNMTAISLTVNVQVHSEIIDAFFYLIVLVWLSFINHCRLSKAKSSLYIYIKYLWYVLVWFYGISNIVGYLISNPFHAYMLNIYDL